MTNQIINELPELLKANIISEETAEKIRLHYSKKNSENRNKIPVVFGILGAILVGLGVILVFAHNWDDLSRVAKTMLSFFPLVLGQFFCGYTLLKKSDQPAWQESSSVFLFFAVGAGISLISQVYNIPGDLNSFIISWMLLSLPLVYLLQSSIVSLLYSTGITYYACNANYFTFSSDPSYWHWFFLLGIVPHYRNLLKNKIQSNFTLFHNWFIALSVVICLGTFAHKNENLMYIAYMSLFAVFYLIGKTPYFEHQKLKYNSFLIFGTTGTLFILLIYTFKSFWEMFYKRNYIILEVLFSSEFIVAILLTVMATILFYKKNRITNFRNCNGIEILFLVNILLFFTYDFAVLLANIIALLIGISEIKRGNKRNDLRILNFGLLIIAILIMCRFFDTDFSFIMRGILFIVIGFGFFLTNYLMLKKRNRNEK